MLDLMTITTFLYRYKLRIFLCGLIGTFIGVLVYIFIPAKYVSTGTFYITRPIEDKAEFSYEGFYSQQTAQAYTDVFVSVLEGKELRSEIITGMGLVNSAGSYYALNRLISIKKTTPSSIRLEVKTQDRDFSVVLWNLIVSKSLEKHRTISLSDKNISVFVLNPVPITYATYKNVYLNSVLGGVIGLFLGTIFFGFKEYYSSLVCCEHSKDVKK